MNEETFLYLPISNTNTWHGTHVTISVTKTTLFINLEFLNHKTWRSRELCLYELDFSKKRWWYEVSLTEYGISKDFEEGMNDIIKFYDSMIKDDTKYREHQFSDLGVLTKENFKKWIDYAKNL